MSAARPFSVRVPESAITDLQRRLETVRWPDEVAQAHWDYGTSLSYLQELVGFWRTGFDWRAAEERLNRIPQFIAKVQEHDIHFIHVRGVGPAPMPIVLTHGWPSTCFEMARLLGPLADPAAHGGDPSDAFDVVVPSLPGYGFSSGPALRGFVRVDILWRRLMQDVLGYPRFMAHGVDIGARVTSALGRFHPDAVIAIHLGSVDLEWPSPMPDESAMSDAERQYLIRCDKWEREEGAYSSIQATKPQTLAYALNDSPVGLAAWIVEKFRSWSDCGGRIENCFTEDELLTNVALYWFTGTINSSMRRYYEATRNPKRLLDPGERIQVPTGIAMFPGEKDLVVPREWAERVYPVSRWTQMPRGGHFPAVEAPDLLIDDIRAYARQFR